MTHGYVDSHIIDQALRLRLKDETKHAVAIKDGKVKDIDNALVITTGNGSYGYPLQERVAS
ncbi:hypothetical protein M3S16_003394 [Escherichia coli]|nr:hypothetical protein [Escherichia coli]